VLHVQDTCIFHVAIPLTHLLCTVASLSYTDIIYCIFYVEFIFQMCLYVRYKIMDLLHVIFCYVIICIYLVSFGVSYCAPSNTLTHSHTHSFTLTLNTLTHPHTLACSYSLSLSHTHTHAHKFTATIAPS
jgi:hypothetical protein